MSDETMDNDNTKSDWFSQFLIAEYNALSERASAYETIKSSRVNFFLLVIAATGALLTAINENKITSGYFFEILTYIVLFNFVVGLLTLKSLVDYSTAVVAFYRRLGRIRHWFTRDDEELSKYLPFWPTDGSPKFLVSNKIIHWRGAEPILIVINAVCFSIIMGILLVRVIRANMIGLVLISLFLGLFFGIIQILYVRFRLKEEEKSNAKSKMVHFPREHKDIKLQDQQLASRDVEHSLEK